MRNTIFYKNDLVQFVWFYGILAKWLTKCNLAIMSCFRNVKIRIFLFVVFCALFPILSTAQNENKLDSTQTKPIPLELGQIPDYGKQTRKLINDIAAKLSKDNNLVVISTGLIDVSKVVNDKYTLLSDTIKEIKIDNLDKEERELSLLNQRILEWKSSIQEIIRDGINKDSSATQMLLVWQLTNDYFNTQEKPEPGKKESSDDTNDLQTEILIFISELNDSKKNLKIFLDSIQNIQREITIVENKIGNIFDLIQTNKRNLQQNIWFPDSPALWEMKKDTVNLRVLQETKEFVTTNKNILSAFFKNNPKLHYYFGLFFLGIFVIILYLKGKSEDLYNDFQEEYQEAKIVLENPFLSSLIIVWFVTLFYTFFPKELKDLISFFMLIPLLFVLKKMNANWKWYSYLLFSSAYILFLIIREIDYSHLLQRIFLIFINVNTIVLFIFYKKKRAKSEIMRKYWFGTLPFIINIFIVLGFIALFVNALGSIRLALLLIYVSLGFIIVIYVLKTAVTLVRNFIYLILLGPLMKHSLILKEDGMLIIHKLDKLFRIVSLIALCYVLLEMLNIGKETLNAFLEIINYRLSIGEMNISLGQIFAFFITIQVAMWISSTLRYILEKEIFPRSQLKQGIPNTILIMIKFTLVVLGILFAFAAAGIHMDKLAIALGALGVGIGFGLQNIISNFISGIILAIERPITIGDLIEIPNVSGVVKDIGLRASTVRTWDGSDVIVPNAELVSNKLTNWTFYDRLRRVKVDVRVPFDTDIELVSKLLLSTANNIPEVMKKPKAYLNFKGIGTSAMEITLYCWTDDSDKIFTYGTAIRKAVYKALREAGFEPPVPVQDLNILSNTNED
jgi:small-conductance mechanosensitive channel